MGGGSVGGRGAGGGVDGGVDGEVEGGVGGGGAGGGGVGGGGAGTGTGGGVDCSSSVIRRRPMSLNRATAASASFSRIICSPRWSASTIRVPWRVASLCAS